MTTEEELQIFCRNLRRLRKAEGLSQRKMAKILRIGVESLRKLEAGIIPPRLGVNALWNVHVHFGIPMSRLFREEL